jgi:hypothetical protein
MTQVQPFFLINMHSVTADQLTGLIRLDNERRCPAGQ